MPSGNRYIWHILFSGFMVFLFLNSSSEKAYAMSQSERSIIWASCRPETAKVTPPKDVCRWFSEQLSVAFPKCDIRMIETVPGDGQADLQAVLVIQRSSQSNLEARLDWSTDNQSWQQGQANGIAMADHGLNPSMLATFLGDLIKGSPPPKSCP